MPLLLVKATLVFALGLLVTRLARRARASVRHMVLASTFGVVILMPGVAALLPSFGIPVLPAAYPVPVAARVASDSPSSAAITLSAAASSPQKSSREWFTLSALVGASWCAGVAVSLLSMVTGLWRIRRVRQAARPWPADAKRTERVAVRAALRRPVEILLHDEIPAPLTCGLLRPIVLLPADALDWNDADLRRALVHELEHVRRGDWFVHGIARVVCALYWFHPLAWIARRHLGLAAEHACDDAVARVTQPAAYAEQLVTLAQRLSARAGQAALSMAGADDLSVRVHALLDGDRARGRAGRLRATAIIGVASTILILLAPVRATESRRWAFDAVSIVRHSSGDRTLARDANARVTYQSAGICGSWGAIGRSDTCLIARRMTVRELIAFAFSPTQLVPPRPPILNGPDWLDNDRFDIVALARGNTAAGRASKAGLALMMRSVLASRFGLRLREEVRPLPVYDLSLLQSDGTWGPQLRRSTVDCLAPLPVLFSGRPLDVPKPRRDPCRSEGGEGYLRSGAMTMSHLASMLSNRMRTVVRDRTGLVGPFEIDLAWLPLGDALSG